MREQDFYRNALPGTPGPLEGVRVVAATKVWSGPLATCVLADLGAEVINVELPGGSDGLAPPAIPGTRRSWWRETVHRNKLSVGLDLRTAADRDRFLDLVATADLVVENYKPGTLDGWGIGYEACRAVRPDIVFVSISGWGQYGPNSHLPAYDPVVQASCGWMDLNGRPGGPPQRAATFLADELAGLHAAIGALAALAHRTRTGEGQHVDVAMLDCILAGSNGYPTLAASGLPPTRLGNETDFVAPANVYECLDGHVYLVISLDKHWRLFADAIGRPGLSEDYATRKDRLHRREEVDGLVAAWCRTQKVNEVVTALGDRGIAVAPVRSFEEAVADPHVSARNMIVETALSDGSTAPLVGPPVKFSRTPTRIRHAAPTAGADTERVLTSRKTDTARTNKYLPPTGA